MVKVSVQYSSNRIMKVMIKDHANTNSKGQDLICAGVSSIVFGMLNALDILANDLCKIDIGEANIQINVENNNKDVQLLLKSLLIQLETMKDAYPKNIEIKKEEVAL